MKNSKAIRGFYHLAEAWYVDSSLRGADYTDEVMFGMYNPEGGTVGEMCVRWSELGRKSVPQLQVFDDAWEILASFSDLIDALRDHDGQNIGPNAFCALLTRLGFQDMTPRENPYGGDPLQRRETMLENTLGAIVDLINSDGVSVIPDDTEVRSHIFNAKKLLGRK